MCTNFLSCILSVIHREGYRFAAIFAGVSLLMFLFSTHLGWMGIILTGWCLYFFRNPNRFPPEDPDLVLSPADGKLIKIEEVTPPASFGMGDEPRIKISIFLNVFNVHVNRIPVKSTIEKIIYHPGKFFNASLDKASEHNESNTLILKTESGHKIAIKQIAGLIARRILCEVVEGEEVETAKVFGLIRFGSRAEVFLPVGVKPLVSIGQTMIAGETVLASLSGVDSDTQDVAQDDVLYGV